jgi:hypothetical protein
MYLQVGLHALLVASGAAGVPTGPTARPATAQDVASSKLSEAWSSVEARAAGPERARAAAQLLADRSLTPGPAETQLAWRIGVEEADALRFESAALVQQALYDRVPALWSAANLALTLNRLHGPEAAERVLAPLQFTATGRDAADLWSQRGTYWCGAGAGRIGRGYLGRAIALGSTDATVVLAREDLENLRIAAARCGFRAALLEPAPSPWALRGFGVALLTP